MPSADQVPVKTTRSMMLWSMWVALIARSTGSALRAVRLPNLAANWRFGSITSFRACANDFRLSRRCRHIAASQRRSATNPRRGPPHGGELRQAAATVAARRSSSVSDRDNPESYGRFHNLLSVNHIMRCLRALGGCSTQTVARYDAVEILTLAASILIITSLAFML